MSQQRGFNRVIFSESTAARHEIVAAPTNQQKIRVRGLFLGAAAAQDILIESDGTTIGPANLSENFSLVLPPTEGGKGEAWLECAADEALNITLGQAVQTDGVIFYDIIPA